MPIPDTKYNYNPLYNYNRLKTDVCNNSFVYTNHILTCDLSDTLIFNDTSRPNKVYLNSKASFLIHPFSKVSNCTTQFSSNNNFAFKYKKPASCPIDASSSINTIQTQKAIQKQIHTSSSNYTQVINSLTVAKDIANNNNNKAWHNASDRSQSHGLTKSLANNLNTSQKINSGLDIKHNSYDRYLAKKKATNLKTQNNTTQINPINLNTGYPNFWGNKTKYYSITTKNSNCLSNC